MRMVLDRRAMRPPVGGLLDSKKSAENTEKQRDQGGRFLTRNSGGPGRPKGSRNKFAQQYIDDYYDVWQRKGIKALEDYADKQPAKFILVAAHLIPQHFKVEHEHKLSMLSDAELQQKLIEKEELRGGPVFRDRMAAWLRWFLGLITPPVSPAPCR
jgi:hypothetical protein